MGSQKIGHKGIGFKSVFKVTDNPHVISGGYQFCFHRERELGYILPEWLDSLDSLPLTPDLSLTTFYLPLLARADSDMKDLYDCMCMT